MATGLGFDTGGTYTDAVIMDLETGAIVCKAKSLTTREDLCIGIRGAIEKFDREELKKVSVVSLSSTLATNSVVEGKGCRVALICIGGEYNFSVRTDYDTEVKGCHDLHGNETEPLDEAAVREFLESIKGKVDGLAITGYLAVRNPEHEKRVKDIAKEILDVPIVCGYELSSSLGFNERTATCIMNARLIPIIDDLIKSVKNVMAEFGIHAPLMIVRGDGSMMGENVAKERPVETILSGPAASLIGAMHITGKKDAIVMDMGGTTTDIGILRNGKPRLEPEGAIIGGKRTRVMAAEIATSGIGGDSRILVNGRNIILSSVRVVPLCIASAHWPCVAEHMRQLENIEQRYTPEALGEQNVVLDSEFFRTLKIPSEDQLSKSDMALLELLQKEPMTLNDAGAKLGIHPFNFNVLKLESRGYIQRIGFTPTDVLHTDGTYTEFDADASKAGAAYLARISGMDVDTFISICKEKIRNKLCMELLKELFMEEARSDKLGPAGEDLAMKAITHQHGRDFGCTIQVDKPIIGIGAPAGVYIRWVGEVFNTEVIVDEDADVGNAIGAVTSSVSESIHILVKPETIGGGDETTYEAFSKMGNFKYKSLEEALAASEEMGRKYVTEAISKSGAVDVSISVDKDEKRFAFGTGIDTSLMEIDMTVTAAGKPKQFSTQ